MAKLVLSFLILNLCSPVWAGVCQISAKVLFAELKKVVHTHKATITTVEVNDMLNGWSDLAENPRITDVFEVSNAFGTPVADFLQHFGHLKNHIDPENIIKGKPSLSDEQKWRIFKRVHLYLSDLIEQTAREKNLSLDELAEQTGIAPKLLYGVVEGMGLPRFAAFLELLAKLNVSADEFLRSVEISLRDKVVMRASREGKIPFGLWRKGEIEERERQLYNKIQRDLEDIFLNGLVPEGNIELMRFKAAILERHSYSPNKKLAVRPINLISMIQTAHMLGLKLSEVFQYAGDLKNHISWDGIESRSLLSRAVLREVSRHIHQRLAWTFRESGKTLKELSDETGMPLRFLRETIINGRNRISYFVMESVLQALNLDAVRFLEKLESGGILDIHSPHLREREANGAAFIGERIIQVKQILAPVASKSRLKKIITTDVDPRTGQTLTQRDVAFETVYKTSRVGNISLSDLVNDRPITTLIEPENANLEQVSAQEIKRARRLLNHLLLGEARRQRDLHDLTLTRLAINAGIYTRRLKILLAGGTPSYSMLRQIVEDGLGIPLPRFLENFEAKLKGVDHLPAPSQNVLAELEGPYLSREVTARVEWVKERFFQVRDLLSALNVGITMFEKATGITSFSAWAQNRHNGGLGQIYTTARLCHFLGISLSDFLGQKDLATLVDARHLNFERLSEESIQRAINSIKDNLNRRRKDLGILEWDFEILLGAFETQKLSFLFSTDAGPSFPWFRYFQSAEILAQEGEDGLFLLEGVAL